MVDLVKDEWEWSSMQVEEVMVVMVPRSEHFSPLAIAAKEKELELLSEFEVYEEVNYDALKPEEKESIVKTTWVIVEKKKGAETIVKA